MTWLLGVLAWIVTYFAVETVGAALFEMLVVPLLSPLRVLDRPPLGGLVLAATWGLAIGITVLGFASVETTWGTAAFVVAIPFALLATYTRRDELRELEKHPVLPRGPRNP